MTRRVILLVVAVALLFSGAAPPAARAGRSASLDAQVADLMADMTPDEIVGQLFLVTFAGSDVSPGSDVANLVLDYHVGGVLLRASNDNITDEAAAPAQVQAMANSLQTLLYNASRPPEGTATPSAGEDLVPFVPLFVAVDHEGDGWPFTAIRTGTTPLPNAMALGATWNRQDAAAIGRITGQELHAMGVNMLLGPSLDVLNVPHSEGPGDLGTRTFGGNPYWVSVLGRAYISGVHEGAGGQMAIVARNFPGHGGSDRRPEDEVATVRSSLEQLKQNELVPFFAVTGEAGDDALAMTDALLTSHIRYQGFQGNIREFTKPISLDPQALETLMQLPQFAAWRANGGLIVSDSLGVQAIKRFYAALGYKQFPNRQVARDAFLAGNDVLLLSGFADPDSWQQQLASIKDTILYFRESYRDDPTFKARVDEAVARVLRLKLSLYGDPFTLDGVLATPEALAQVGQGRDQVFQVARDAVTLIDPPLESLPDRVPSLPSLEDNIVIFTDVRDSRQCSFCPARPLIAVDALQQTMVRLYGTSASRQVDPRLIRSYSFADLKELLAVQAGSPGATPAPPEVITRTAALADALASANWVFFAMLDVVPEVPASDAVKEFLSERPDLASGKKVIAISYSAPYYLDTTEISKLTAYYAAYSKAEPFIDASIRAVFQEMTPHGSPPVSITGVGYNLAVQTSPDPAQDIALTIVDSDGNPSPPPDLKLDDELRVAAGPIVDHGGRPVPDGTLVRFHRTYPQERMTAEDIVTATVNGVAMGYIPIERQGTLEITVSSESAAGKSKITIRVPELPGTPVMVETPLPTATTVPPPATETVPPSPSPTGTPVPETGEDGRNESVPRVTAVDLLGALAGIALLGGLAYWYGRGGAESMAEGVRWALTTVAGGLLGYNLYALGVPGTDALRLWLAGWAAVALAWVGAAAGFLVAGLLAQSRETDVAPRDPDAGP